MFQLVYKVPIDLRVQDIKHPQSFGSIHCGGQDSVRRRSSIIIMSIVVINNRGFKKRLKFLISITYSNIHLKHARIMFWWENLIVVFSGRSTESTSMNTFSGSRRPHDIDMPYLSTSSYTRQMVGTERPRKQDNGPMGMVLHILILVHIDIP